MTIYHYYIISAVVYAAYMIGLFGGQKKSNWRYFAVSVACGAVWPVMIVCGMILTHWHKDEDL